MDATLETELHELKRQSPLLWRFVVARAEHNTDNQALAVIDRSTAWLHLLPEKQYLSDLADRLRNDRVQQAAMLLEQAATAAARVMLDDLQCEDRKLRQSAAKDILDRLGVRAPDKTQIDVVASVNSRTLEDVLLSVYAKRQERLQPGSDDVIDGQFQDAPNA